MAGTNDASRVMFIATLTFDGVQPSLNPAVSGLLFSKGFASGGSRPSSATIVHRVLIYFF